MVTGSEGISLNKFISSTGFCSRREADKYIEQGRVSINNRDAHSGSRVFEGDTVAIDGEKLKAPKTSERIYIALNKPVGVTSTTDTRDKTNIVSYVNFPKRIFPIGRLDKDSDGLIFLTNDGDIVNKILRAGNYHEKEYIVTVDQPITPEFVRKMSNGVYLDDKLTQKCVVKQEGNKRFRIILTQGIHRQIRRMCYKLGYEVVTLTRVRIMHVRLGNLPVGKWRQFTPQEVAEMNRLLSNSSKTEEASAMPARKKVAPKPAPSPPTSDSVTGKTPVHGKKSKTYKEWRRKK